MRVILLFVDGVGIGAADAAVNPFFRAELPWLRGATGGRIPHHHDRRISSPRLEIVPADATLRMPGLPQSGTGQTTIFTGTNAARVFGRHFGPFPPTSLRTMITERNIFRRLQRKGRSVVFANAFPSRFFEYTESGTRRLSVTTLSCKLAGVPLLRAEDLLRNEAVSADLIRSRWGELGHPAVKPISPREAGHHLWSIAARHDFTLFEYWLTDHAGHSQKMDFAVNVLELLDEFLGGFFERFDFDNSLFVMVSDHGNIEDLSTKTHTRNPVPCMILGSGRKKFAHSIHSLIQITPTVVRMLGSA